MRIESAGRLTTDIEALLPKTADGNNDITFALLGSLSIFVYYGRWWVYK